MFFDTCKAILSELIIQILYEFYRNFGNFDDVNFVQT